MDPRQRAAASQRPRDTAVMRAPGEHGPEGRVPPPGSRGLARHTCLTGAAGVRKLPSAAPRPSEPVPRLARAQLTWPANSLQLIC